MRRGGGGGGGRGGATSSNSPTQLRQTTLSSDSGTRSQQIYNDSDIEFWNDKRDFVTAFSSSHLRLTLEPLHFQQLMDNSEL